MNKLNVGILIFHDVEVLDFAGPFEVFSRTRMVPGIESRRSEESAPFSVFTVAQTPEPLSATGGLQIIPSFHFGNAPAIDVLVVPGGFGTRTLLDDEETISWLKQVTQSAQQVTSVCTGALLLAQAGLLHKQHATTHWGALDVLAGIDPTITVEKEKRVVVDSIITSAGVSAGIDMALTLVEQLFGKDVADETARYMEWVMGDRGQGT